MDNILDLNLEELKSVLTPSFRAKQVFTWLHQKLVSDFAAMTDLPEELRLSLGKQYSIILPKIKSTSTSKDGTVKFLFGLEDGNLIESVLLKDRTDRKTICLSTQAGCPMECSFCATGKMGLKRNLSVSEIIGQVYQIMAGSLEIANLVFMGMGEPLLNYDNVIKALRILISKEGQNFGQRKITVSTCGIPDGIKRFADENFQVRLAVSLNSADDAIRERLMPINKTYPLSALKDAVEYYITAAGRRVTFEYIMLDGINDRKEDAEKLVKFCQQLRQVNVNLIPFNQVEGGFKPSKKETIEEFLKTLDFNQINAVLRHRRGEDIKAACGQLAGENK
ncbi:MAG: 23S rRNA (adenine(2503)-C(2))-methyltransferase RlmN [Candidatus Margulisiibacteriota bacterium]